MLSVPDARSRILDGLAAVGHEACPLMQAHGRVLAQPVIANTTQPPASMSAMDGYAVRVAEMPKAGTRLPLAGSVAAGAVPEANYPANHCVRIFTGAVVPDGFDAVIPQEDTEASNDQVVFSTQPTSGQHIRLRGQDFLAGDAALTPGQMLTARDLGLLAAMNVPWVTAYRRPVIGLLATGDEILMPGEPMREAAIIGSSGPALQALLEGWGCKVRNLGVAKDNLADLTAAIGAAKGVDLLVTTGGVSVGTHDLIRALLADDYNGPGDGSADDADHDSQLDFWRIAMRPGKPLLWGQVDGLPLLGLPGNPVSAMICGLLFLYPAIQALRGTGVEPLPIRDAFLGADLAANGPREHYMRATLDSDSPGQLTATPFSSQDSSRMGILSAADGLIIQAVKQPALAKGKTVSVISFTDIHGF